MSQNNSGSNSNTSEISLDSGGQLVIMGDLHVDNNKVHTIFDSNSHEAAYLQTPAIYINNDTKYVRVTCSSCKQQGNQVFSYDGPKITRSICKKCFTRIMDKIFEIGINSELEQTLYDK